MKLFFSFILIVLSMAFFYFNSTFNTNTSIGLKDLLLISDTKEGILYSFKNISDSSEAIEFKFNKDTEVILVTGESSTLNNNINITIDRPNKNVILVLNSTKPIIWNIKKSVLTNINLVVYDGLKSKILSKNKIYKYKTKLELPFDIESKSFVSLFRNLHKLFNIEKVSYFHTKKILNNDILISQTSNDPRLKLSYHTASNVGKNISFRLIDKHNKFIDFDLYGPKNENDRLNIFNQNIVASPNERKLYKIAKNGILIINPLTNEEILKPILVLKELKDTRGIAYDSLTDMVYIANKEGKFFIFDAIHEQWHSIRKYIDDYSINSLSYDYLSNIFIASNWKEDGLIFFDQKGNFDRKYTLKEKLKGIEYHTNKSMETPSLHIVPRGNDIAIVLIDKIVKKIWYFNKLERKAYLTYNFY